MHVEFIFCPAEFSSAYLSEVGSRSSMLKKIPFIFFLTANLKGVLSHIAPSLGRTAGVSHCTNVMLMI